MKLPPACIWPRQRGLNGSIVYGTGSIYYGPLTSPGPAALDSVTPPVPVDRTPPRPKNARTARGLERGGSSWARIDLCA